MGDIIVCSPLQYNCEKNKYEFPCTTPSKNNRSSGIFPPARFQFVSCTVGAYFCSVLVYYKTRSIRAFP